MWNRLFSLILIFSILLIHPQVTQLETPEFLTIGSYAQYRQAFTTGEVHELFWMITSMEHDIIEIETRSRGLEYNSSSNSLMIVPGGGLLVVNKTTLQIIKAYHPNGTEIDEMPLEQIAFWIPTTTNESTSINSMYESMAYPTAVGPLHFECLPTSRMCWKTENRFSPGNQMNRYYDQETGIVVMIESNRTVLSSTISILETLNDTNIAPLLQNGDALGYNLLILAGGIGITTLIVIALYIYKRR